MVRPNGHVTVALKRFAGCPYVPAAVPQDLTVALGEVLTEVLSKYLTHHLDAIGIRGALCFRTEGFVWEVDTADWCLTFEDGQIVVPPTRGPGMTREGFEKGPLERVLPGPGTRVTWPVAGPTRSFLVYFETADPEWVLRSVRDAVSVRDVMSN